jgi:nitrite reductase (NO-forming)/hydroxylamine reductase
MKHKYLYGVAMALLALLLGLTACGGGAAKATPTTQAAQGPKPGAQPTYKDVIAKAACGACHVIPGVDGAVGTLAPDLNGIGKRGDERIKDPAYKGKAKSAVEYIRESIMEPDTFTVAQCPTGPCQKGTMPTNLSDTLSKEEIDAVVNYLAGLK